MINASAATTRSAAGMSRFWVSTRYGFFVEPQSNRPGNASRVRRPKSKPESAAFTEGDLAMYREAYEEGKRSLDDQIAELNSIRDRSSQFLAFVGGATAFLVVAGLGAATGTARTTWFYVIATAASVSSILTVLALVGILLAMRLPGLRVKRFALQWKFRTSPKTLVDEWIDPQIGALEPAAFYRQLALAYQRNMDSNERSLSTVRRSYALFLTMGTIQVLLWGALVWVFA